jgi:hypothetical protein
MFQRSHPMGLQLASKVFPKHSQRPESIAIDGSKIQPRCRAHNACKFRSLRLQSAWGPWTAEAEGTTISTQMYHTRLNLKSMNKKEDCHAELDGLRAAGETSI